MPPREPVSFDTPKPIRLPSPQALSALSKRPLAVLVSDVHLSHQPPVARSEEPDWYKAMAKTIAQVRQLAEGTVLAHANLPGVFCAGDIFDRWNPPVELVNFALANLPHMYAVPGQHDLPNHRYEDVYRSAYWTLVEAGVVIDVPPDAPVAVTCGTPVRLHGFPWGAKVRPLKAPHDLYLEVALVHAMIWTKNTGFPDAPAEARLKNWAGRLRGYDVAVMGDNHKGFVAGPPSLGREQWVANNGTLFRRRTDEVDYRPAVGLLFPDGTVTRHYLDTDGESILSKGELGDAADDPTDVGGVMEKLAALKESRSDFRAAVYALMETERVSAPVRRLLLEALGESDGR